MISTVSVVVEVRAVKNVDCRGIEVKGWEARVIRGEEVEG